MIGSREERVEGRTGWTLDCHFVGHKVKSEKPLRPSSLSRPINTALQLSLRVRWSAARDRVFGFPATSAERCRGGQRANPPRKRHRICPLCPMTGYLCRGTVPPKQRHGRTSRDMPMIDPLYESDLYLRRGPRMLGKTGGNRWGARLREARKPPSR